SPGGGRPPRSAGAAGLVTATAGIHARRGGARGGGRGRAGTAAEPVRLAAGNHTALADRRGERPHGGRAPPPGARGLGGGARVRGRAGGGCVRGADRGSSGGPGPGRRGRRGSGEPEPGSARDREPTGDPLGGPPGGSALPRRRRSSGTRT